MSINTHSLSSAMEQGSREPRGQGHRDVPPQLHGAPDLRSRCLLWRAPQPCPSLPASDLKLAQFKECTQFSTELHLRSNTLAAQRNVLRGPEQARLTAVETDLTPWALGYM